MVSRLAAAEALSVQETCEVGGFGKSTFYVLVNSGLLPAKKLGKKTLVLRSPAPRLVATHDRELLVEDGSSVRRPGRTVPDQGRLAHQLERNAKT